jgi:hypothetical protein
MSARLACLVPVISRPNEPVCSGQKLPTERSPTIWTSDHRLAPKADLNRRVWHAQEVSLFLSVLVDSDLLMAEFRCEPLRRGAASRGS